MRIVTVVFTLVAAISVFISPAFSGDFAKRHIHGFSVDGGLFAFEEYGVQDGSGFAYANLYLIDTATDNWTAGSPFRVLLDDDTKTVFEARQQVKMLAGPVMKSFEDRGNIVATNQPTELVDNPKRMTANPRLVVPPIDQPIEFRLENVPIASNNDCESFGQASFGFKLTRTGIAEGETARVLHTDSNIPASRHCPFDYQFADIVTYYPDARPPVFAVLILMKKIGFEGPDGRYLAVTGQLE